jgi:putative membrane protein
MVTSADPPQPNLLGVKMFRGHNTRAYAILMAGAVLALSACKKKDAEYSDSTKMADTGMNAMDTTAAVAPAPALSDANIVYILDNANALDSAGGAIAATKGTNSEVRDFGKEMMGDHHKLRAEGQALAKKLGVTPEAPAYDDSKASYDKTMSLYNGAAKGKDFDKAYIDNEVTYHKGLLETATAAMNAAQNPELKNFIQKAAPAVQAHLDHAQAIQGKLQ